MVMVLEATLTDRCDDLHDSYPPCRLMVLMRLYHYLNDSRPPMDPETAGTLKRVIGPGGWREESQAKRADVDNALSKLMVADAEMFEAVSDYVDGIPTRDTARRLGISHTTVRTRRDEGVWMCARWLGWDQDCCRAVDVRCPAPGGVL